MTEREALGAKRRRVLRERQERFYEFERWAQPTVRARGKAAAVECRPKPPDGFILASEGEYPTELHAERVMRYVFVAEDSRADWGPAVEIVVAECKSARAARASVMDVLANQMANILQPAESLGIGEVCFAPRADEPTFVLFARGPIAIHVQSVGRVDVPVVGFTRRLDECLAISTS